MLPKAAVPTVIVLAATTTLRLLGTQSNTNIAKTSKQLIERYKDIIT